MFKKVPALIFDALGALKVHDAFDAIAVLAVEVCEAMPVDCLPVPRWLDAERNAVTERRGFVEVGETVIDVVVITVVVTVCSVGKHVVSVTVL